LRFAQLRALGRKASDEFIVALCRAHHRELHRCGDEADWWRKSGIDPLAAARTLWLETHPLRKSKANVKHGGADDNAKSQASPPKRSLDPSRKFKTNPNEKAAPHDVV
jgi:hypothetical protein